MSQPTLDPGELAWSWLLAEAGQWEAQALAEALDRLCGRLRDHLSPLVGRAGFAALLARAVHLAQATYPGLALIALDETGASDSCLRGVHEFATAHTPTEVEAALTAILTQFFGLLVTFIGAALTIRMLGEIWPELGRAATNDMGTEAGQ